MRLRSWKYAFWFFFAFFFAFSFFFFLRYALHFHPYPIIWHYFSLKIKIICCILISKGSLNIFLYIKKLLIICRFLYHAPMEMRFFASLFVCVFVFCVCVFFCVFVFLRFRFFFFASSFSEICVFVLWNLRFRSLKYASSFFSKNENDVNFAVASIVGVNLETV